MTISIRRIPLGPVAKISFVLYFVLSFVGALFSSLFMMGIMSFAASILGEMNFPFPVETLAGSSLIIFGLFGAVFGAVTYTIITLILVLVYNAIASYLGGIEINIDSPELDEVEAKLKNLEAKMKELETVEPDNTGTTGDIDSPGSTVVQG